MNVGDYVNELKATRAEYEELKSAVEGLLECPFILDKASVPKAGIAAAPFQVVGNMSVSYLRLLHLRLLVGQHLPIMDEIGESVIRHSWKRE